jgi:hypothetical protein
LRVAQFVLQGRKLLVVELELEFEGTIRHSPAALQEVHDLVEYLVKVHRHPSTDRGFTRGYRA